MADSLTVYAMEYAFAGLRVHPVRADKRPLTRWGSEATTDLDVIKVWWNRWPDALIAVCTGGGLVVVDDDRGLAEPDEWFRDTLTCRTRSRGYHHWFGTNEKISNAVGLLPGIDVRGEGGYVIAPPSPGWEWLDADAPMLPLPRIFIEHGELRQRSAHRYGSGFEPATRVAEGGRNDYIARYAGYAIRMGVEDEAELVDDCIVHNHDVCVPPLDNREVERTARSILRRHERA